MIMSSGDYRVGWQKKGQAHGYLKFASVTAGGSEEGLWDKDKYRRHANVSYDLADKIAMYFKDTDYYLRYAQTVEELEKSKKLSEYKKAMVKINIQNKDMNLQAHTFFQSVWFPTNSFKI